MLYEVGVRLAEFRRAFIRRIIFVRQQGFKDFFVIHVEMSVSMDRICFVFKEKEDESAVGMDGCSDNKCRKQLAFVC